MNYRRAALRAGENVVILLTLVFIGFAAYNAWRSYVSSRPPRVAESVTPAASFYTPPRRAR